MPAHSINKFKYVDADILKIKGFPAASQPWVLDLLAGFTINEMPQELIDQIAGLHRHENLHLLDKITEDFLAMIDKLHEDIHSHSNKAVLNQLTQIVFDKIHEHANRDIIDSLSEVYKDGNYELMYKGNLIVDDRNVSEFVTNYFITNNLANEEGINEVYSQFMYRGILTSIYRVGNLVNWSVAGNAINTAVSPIPEGFRPLGDIRFSSGQMTGQTPRYVTINSSGVITTTEQLEPIIGFNQTWITNNSFPESEESAANRVVVEEES
jgi:hypothetical protein